MATAALTKYHCKLRHYQKIADRLKRDSPQYRFLLQRDFPAMPRAGNPLGRKAGLLASGSSDASAPSHSFAVNSGVVRGIFPVTAAGPRRIHTVFPFYEAHSASHTFRKRHNENPRRLSTGNNTRCFCASLTPASYTVSSSQWRLHGAIGQTVAENAAESA